MKHPGFNKVADKIAANYEMKGMTPQRALLLTVLDAGIVVPFRCPYTQRRRNALGACRPK